MILWGQQTGAIISDNDSLKNREENRGLDITADQISDPHSHNALLHLPFLTNVYRQLLKAHKKQHY